MKAKSQSSIVADIHVTKLSSKSLPGPEKREKLIIHRADHRTSEGAEQCAVSDASAASSGAPGRPDRLGEGSRCWLLEHRS